jgi:PIN domain nuclease of toxin-antitoxin system
VIVLDTHAWLWWVGEPRRLGRRTARAIDDADRIGIAAVSCFEVAAAVAKGRVILDRPPLHWLQDALALPKVELLPLTAAVAVNAIQLAAFHGDPADRLIVATTIIEGAVLATMDRRLRGYAVVQTVW